MLYVKDKTFSTFYNYNNLIKEFDGDTEDFLLNDLPYKSAEKWDKAEKIFVLICIYYLNLDLPHVGGSKWYTFLAVIFKRLF